MSFSLEGSNPVILHSELVAACLAVFGHVGSKTSSWSLVAHRDTIEMVKTYGMVPKPVPTPLGYCDRLELNRIPKTIITSLRHLQIDPVINRFNCCSDCFALYPIGNTPRFCSHQLDDVHGHLLEEVLDGSYRCEWLPARCPADGPSPVRTRSKSKTRNDPTNQNQPQRPAMCLQPMFRTEDTSGASIRQYAFQDFDSWLARLICRPGMEQFLDQSLTESRKPFDPDSPVHDIHKSSAWKDFRAPDGSQFTAKTGNLGFALFADGINPFGVKKGGKSITDTFIIMVCLTLPIEMRFVPENVFLVGIAPGPREPSLEEINWILGPVVTQLTALWNQGLFLSKTPMYPQGRLIYAALILFVADVPATRLCLGLASHSANHFCSICHLQKQDVNNLDESSWPRRTSEEHNKLALAARDGDTKARSKIFQSHGVRYSVLVELEYWSLIDCHVVDSMHNLLLGLLKFHCRHFWLMTDEIDVMNVKPTSNAEIRDLIMDASKRVSKKYDNPAYTALHTSPERDEDVPFLDEDLDPSTDDISFDAFPGWDGDWSHPLESHIVFDRAMLDRINALLSRIFVPTWITRAIPVLGKISFGQLKADEWRTLFTLQLPLLLPVIWSQESDQGHLALLQNFIHLVCLVNLALKRTMTHDRISGYRKHLSAYLKSSQILFPHRKLVVNHHLAVHLAERLERFGSVRTWWSFPYEQMMYQILRNLSNGRLGESSAITSVTYPAPSLS